MVNALTTRYPNAGQMQPDQWWLRSALAASPGAQHHGQERSHCTTLQVGEEHLMDEQGVGTSCFPVAV